MPDVQNILGIETSCDETGVALYSAANGLVGDLVYTQADHAAYGGVVPELASRDHVRKLPGMVRELLDSAGMPASELDAVAYTAGPGLAGALLVGAATGVALAAALDVPAIAVHHMEGHLLSPLLEDPAPDFPFVALLVSGGHTMLVAVEGFARYSCWARHSTMPPARPSTRPRACSAWAIPAVPRWPGWRRAVTRTASSFRGR